MVTKT